VIAVEPALTEAIERARARWPKLDEQTLRERVAALSPETLDAIEFDDLTFAVACAHGDPAALQTLDRDRLPALRPALARLGLDRDGIDEVLQLIRTELFAPRAEGPPRILGYSGRGKLASWLRSVAVRTGLRMIRTTPRHELLDEGAAAGSIADDVELAYMKKTYGEAFQRAFRAALGALPARDRLLLKQRFRHSMGVEDLGRLHGVHAGTISRWVTSARDALASGTRSAMMEELGVAKTDVSSILRLIESQIEVTLSTVER
jgi:RNA polymerase sigma-70 factor (ECF subfamily)